MIILVTENQEIYFCISQNSFEEGDENPQLYTWEYMRPLLVHPDYTKFRNQFFGNSRLVNFIHDITKAIGHIAVSILQFEQDDYKQYGSFFQFFGFRLKILRLLGDGKKNVCEIIEATNKPQPFISQHLRVLREKKVVITKRDGNEVYYSLSDPKIVKICELVAEMINKRQ